MVSNLLFHGRLELGDLCWHGGEDADAPNGRAPRLLHKVRDRSSDKGTAHRRHELRLH